MRVFALFLITAADVCAQSLKGWKLVGGDEFNAAMNTPPDPAKWNFNLAGGGWGNGEFHLCECRAFVQLHTGARAEAYRRFSSVRGRNHSRFDIVLS